MAKGGEPGSSSRLVAERPGIQVGTGEGSRDRGWGRDFSTLGWARNRYCGWRPSDRAEHAEAVDDGCLLSAGLRRDHTWA